MIRAVHSRCVNTVMIIGKYAFLGGYGKDCASALRGPGDRVLFSEDQATEDRFVFSVGHGVPASGPQYDVYFVPVSFMR